MITPPSMEPKETIGVRFRALPSIVVVVASVLLGSAAAAPPYLVPRAGAGEMIAPPMGWNSWNSGIELTEQNIHEVIDSMVASGMRDAGYRYVDLDAGWAYPERDLAGNLQADPRRFPHGMAALADYAHQRGMYLGLYSSPYNEICGQTPDNASLGHEVDDARTFASWGVDMLKYDWCRNDADLATQVRDFTAMRDALHASGRRILYSINPNSSNNLHAAADYDWSQVANMTRNTSDLIPLWRNGLPELPIGTTTTRSLLGVTDEVGAAQPLAARSRPGYWNDPDMLVVGIQLTEFIAAHLAGFPETVLRGALTTDQMLYLESSLEVSPQVIAQLRDPQFSLNPDEQRAHFSLWAMLAAPLLAGNDVRSMTEQTRSLLTNPDVIAVDQDPAVIQAAPLPGDARILTKPLTDGSLAVAMFNTADAPATIETTTAALGLHPSGCYTVRDLWAHNGTTTTGPLRGADIPAHGVAMLKISAAC
ncbi:glycoside hydrolase family 27 protein [Nocardia sp. NPDC020380]|uniref:glycoside hydrolase family 27 protein n=1 Tax=Nocardia sp. NPDC020380 TaxID=3364309 RepID=UPI00379488DA